MKTSIMIGKDSQGWKAVIIEGPGVLGLDRKTTMRLSAPKSESQPDDELIAQLPQKRRDQIESQEVFPVFVYGPNGLKD